LLDGNEAKYLNECIASGWISSEGPFVEEFETRFAARVGRKYAIAVTNGTAAIDLAVEALDIGPGDEVILPTFTIISCVHQVLRAGATPVFIDADPETWCMDVSSIERKIGPRTRAIMAVHIYGIPVDMEPVLELARARNLRVIEDAAEAHGQTYRDRPCGSFGDISTFSFYPNKLITTGEGGMVLTDAPEIAEACRSLRNLCFQSDRRFVHERLGWNFRMTNLQAALGVAQLERMDEFLRRKRAIGQRYRSALKGIPGVAFQPDVTDFARNAYWVFGLLLRDEAQGRREHVCAKLAEKGIGTRPFFFPLHRQPVLLRDFGYSAHGALPVAERLGDDGFYIPSGLALTDQQIDEVSDALWGILG